MPDLGGGMEVAKGRPEESMGAEVGMGAKVVMGVVLVPEVAKGAEVGMGVVLVPEVVTEEQVVVELGNHLPIGSLPDHKG